MHSAFRREFTARAYFVRVAVCFFSAAIMASCRSSVQNRPWGYLKLGKLTDFTQEETYLPDNRLLVRRDARGLYVMSTASTYDLTALRRQASGSGEVWVSEEDSSRFDRFGKVLAGPAVADLPYYELKLDVGEVGGPKDTLYVVVGSPRAPDWRFPIPAG